LPAAIREQVTRHHRGEARAAQLASLIGALAEPSSTFCI
jgi:hypothetical protein